MHVYSILEHGAVGDGMANDAAAIQKAIDACHSAGGGRVLVPTGRTYLCGSFSLKSNVELHVEAGARLLGATREQDYPLFAFVTGHEAGKRLWIGAQDAENVSITGMGTVDGNSDAFSLARNKHIHSQTLRWRPAMICFTGCRHVRVRDLLLRHAANWALHFTGCDDVAVEGVTIRNDLTFPNCDGIDPDHCRNVRISNCHVEAGDDAIVIKNTEPFRHYGDCENITVTNCTLISTSSAIKIGTESRNDFRDMVFSNCVIRGSNRGLSIQLRDGGSVENLLFCNNIVETRLFAGGWWGAGEPIYVTSLPRTHETRQGQIRNVRFSNILCRGESGIFVMGSAPDRIRDVVFDAVQLEVRTTTEWPGSCYDTRPCPPDVLPHGAVPQGEQTPWGVKCSRPVPGIYVENASDVLFRNCDVTWRPPVRPCHTHALEARNAPGLRIEGFRGTAARADLQPVVQYA